MSAGTTTHFVQHACVSRVMWQMLSLNAQNFKNDALQGMVSAFACSLGVIVAPVYAHRADLVLGRGIWGVRGSLHGW